MTFYELVQQKLRNLFYDDYIVFQDENGKVFAKHIICGEEFEITDINNVECHKCEKKTTEDIREMIFSMTDGEYYLISEYKTPHDVITIAHNKCGGAFDTTLNKFLSENDRCPDCKYSKGEQMVREWLIKNNIAHVKQYRFPDCKFKRTLPFDFYLPTFNTVIEFDGDQHFYPVERFGGVRAFQYRRRCDFIKTKYCIENNIRLIRLTKESDFDEDLKVILDELHSRHNTYKNDEEDFPFDDDFC